VVHKPYIFPFTIPFFLTLEYSEYLEKFCKQFCDPVFSFENVIYTTKQKLTAKMIWTFQIWSSSPTFSCFETLFGAFVYWAAHWTLLDLSPLAHTLNSFAPTFALTLTLDNEYFRFRLSIPFDARRICLIVTKLSITFSVVRYWHLSSKH
jgi:hypothetical protein